MKEDIQIEQAARLADTKAPENLSNERARSFVRETMGKRRFFSAHPGLAWGGTAFAFTLAAALAVVLIIPAGREASPVDMMQEMHSVHAASEVADTTAVSSADTLDTFEIPTSETISE